MAEKKPTGKRPRARTDWTPEKKAAHRARQAARAYLRDHRPEVQVERMRRSEKAVVAEFFSRESLLAIFGEPKP